MILVIYEGSLWDSTLVVTGELSFQEMLETKKYSKKVQLVLTEMSLSVFCTAFFFTYAGKKSWLRAHFSSLKRNAVFLIMVVVFVVIDLAASLYM